MTDIDKFAPKNGELAIRYPGSIKWKPLSEAAYRTLSSNFEVNENARKQIDDNKSALSSFLQKALQLPNLAIFAGSGTSLGNSRGPRMLDLWNESMEVDGQLTELAAAVCDKINYDSNNKNIEHFLSRCDAYQYVFNESAVSDFVSHVKINVLRQCSDFLNDPQSDIKSYNELLRKMARRRVRDPRLKIFTTNYDMCFESASSNLGMMVVDGFSYTRKRRFDGKYFNYDVIERGKDESNYIQGVIQLYKLHGSVSWERELTDVYEVESPSPDKACLIYPAKGKYQQAFVQPHLELLSRFLDFLRQQNSCLLVSGFGFNDDHLSEPILAAVEANPSFKLIIADYSAAMQINDRSNYWAKLSNLASKGSDVTFINTSFDDMVELIPNLVALSPAEKLAESLSSFANFNKMDDINELF